MKKETKLLIILLLFALIIRILFAFSSPVKWWDETVYSNLGYDLSKNPFDYSFANNGWSDFTSVGSWPKAGFRAPLLPYALSLFYFLNLRILIDFLIPVIGTLSIALVYFLGKRMFNTKVGIYSAIFLSLVPLHVYFSGRVLTDVFSTFFILLSIFCFWKGYEEDDKKFKLLFGFCFALALLSRYTSLWLIPSFAVCLCIKSKSLKFLKDRYLWRTIGIFFITISPLLIYSQLTYNNLFGAFIHGAEASSYWGGTQPWFFFFQNWITILSVIGVIFLCSLIYIIKKREFKLRNIYFILIFTFLFLGLAMIMPHKEERIILPIIPLICIICGYFISRLSRYKNLLLFLMITILITQNGLNVYREYQISYTEDNTCFLQGNEFLLNKTGDMLVITKDSPLIYYYSKKENHFSPDPWSLESLKYILSQYKGKEVYIFFSNKDAMTNNKEQEDLEENFEKVFDCKNKTLIYYFNNL